MRVCVCVCVEGASWIPAFTERPPECGFWPQSRSFQCSVSPTFIFLQTVLTRHCDQKRLSRMSKETARSAANTATLRTLKEKK